MTSKMTPKQQDIVTENHNLIYKFAKQHQLDLEEYYGILALALCQASMYYNENQGKFSTLAFRYMSNAVRNNFKAQARLKRSSALSVSLDIVDLDNINSDFLFFRITSNGSDVEHEIESIETVQTFFSMLSTSQQLIVQGRLKGLSEKEIATQMNCTQQNVNHQIQKIKLKWENFYSLN